MMATDEKFDADRGQRIQASANTRDATKEAFSNGTATRLPLGNARCCSGAMAMRQHSLAATDLRIGSSCGWSAILMLPQSMNVRFGMPAH